MALKNINYNKAMGYDINTYFLKKTWGQIGEDITYVMLHFFSTGKLCKVINCTTVTIILKVDCSSKVLEFRPISCCTLLYKIISEMLTNMMQCVMEILVN